MNKLKWGGNIYSKNLKDFQITNVIFKLAEYYVK